jgi:hypothetical protein
MKKVIFIVIPSVILALIVFLSFQFYINRISAKGALQVTANPQSKVYLDGKYIGQTPLCKCEANDMINSGNYTIRLEPSDSQFGQFEEKISISNSVLTVVDRKFGRAGGSEGSIISLSPLKSKDAIELMVVTFPEQAEVLLDNVLSGMSPLLLEKNITESDHTLRFKKTGYTEKPVRIRTPKGYRLTATIYLAVDDQALNPSGSQSASVTPSGPLTPSPSPSKAVAEKVTILQTPNGFLRVRASASLSGAEISRVASGDTFELLDETTGWYKIALTDGTEGWVSSDFAEKE